MSKFLKQILAKQNSVVTITSRKPLKIRKGAEAVFKTASFPAQIGSDLETLDLPWGEWHTPGLVIVHNNAQYVRCTRVRAEVAPVVSYTDSEGNAITEETARLHALAGEFPKVVSPEEGVFTIKLENILAIE
jgi:hypothetical protein